MSRRTFLKIAGAGSATVALTAAGGYTFLENQSKQPPKEVFRFLPEQGEFIDEETIVTVGTNQEATVKALQVLGEEECQKFGISIKRYTKPEKFGEDRVTIVSVPETLFADEESEDKVWEDAPIVFLGDPQTQTRNFYRAFEGVELSEGIRNDLLGHYSDLKLGKPIDVAYMERMYPNNEAISILVWVLKLQRSDFYLNPEPFIQLLKGNRVYVNNAGSERRGEIPLIALAYEDPHNPINITKRVPNATPLPEKVMGLLKKIIGD